LILLGILDEMARAGALAPGRGGDAVWSCWAVVHGMAELCVHGPLQGLPRQETDRLAGQTLDTLIASLTRDVHR
ncbi:TetR family transcriptional regulator, partial [Spongiactinospora gelatinilytica]